MEFCHKTTQFVEYLMYRYAPDIAPDATGNAL